MKTAHGAVKAPRGTKSEELCGGMETGATFQGDAVDTPPRGTVVIGGPCRGAMDTPIQASRSGTHTHTSV